MQQASDLADLMNRTQTLAPFRSPSEILAVVHFGALDLTLKILEAHLNH
jgi:hypothetical protein